MIKLLAFILLLTPLFGCANKPQGQDVTIVQEKVPVTQPCKKTADPNSPPVFSANDAAMKNLPYPDAADRLRKNPQDVQAKADVDVNVYYLMKIMAADRLETRAWIDKLGAALNGCP